MAIAQHAHPTRLAPPWYAQAEAGGLHRYLDPDFINRYRQDVQRRHFEQAQFSRWIGEDANPRGDGRPVLRLPLHRSFHLFCCEVVCDRFGTPALEPAKVSSAGFVIRRIAGGREQAWMVEDGVALGWHDCPTEQRDPDVHRRLCANGVLHRRADQPAYNGEETHPLHVLPAIDDKGKRHTLLYGYVPLGGSYFMRQGETGLDADARAEIDAASKQALPWPFGFRDTSGGGSGGGSGFAFMQAAFVVGAGDAGRRVIDRGVPDAPMFELLRLLVSRYHLGEAGIDENEALLALCGRLEMQDPGTVHKRAGAVRGAQQTRGGQFSLTLGAYLRACFARGGDNPLVAWIARQEQRADAAGGIAQLSAFERLPIADAGANADADETLDLDLTISTADAQEVRELLGQRLLAQTLALVREIPLPKFAQGDNDIYQIVPFVRALDDDGREHIEWAGTAVRSIPFRVAAPFDPEASRPSLIQMPSMADLKRGLARGVSMLTPADTFKMLSGLKLNKGASPEAVPEEPPGGGNGMQWICSFSLPVVTIVAMILLMIMVTVLNLLFFWIPWVRICLPFPKIKGGPPG